MVAMLNKLRVSIDAVSALFTAVSVQIPLDRGECVETNSPKSLHTAYKRYRRIGAGPDLFEWASLKKQYMKGTRQSTRQPPELKFEK